MIEKNAQGWRVTCAMLIADASALLEAGRGFLRSAERGSQLLVDLGAVTETDSSALSVLFGWQRTAQEQGVKLRFSNPPASMLSLAALYGVSESLPLA